MYCLTNKPCPFPCREDTMKIGQDKNRTKLFCKQFFNVEKRAKLIHTVVYIGGGGW